MPVTENGGNDSGSNPLAIQPPPPVPSSPSNYKDLDGNEITLGGKRLAGFMLIFFTLFSALYVVGHWPDRLVGPREPVKPLYTYNWFNVRLAGIPDTGNVIYLNDNTLIAGKTGIVKTSNTSPDTTFIPDTLKDSLKISTIIKANDSIRKKYAIENANPKKQFAGKRYPPENTLIHINTLLLILVAMSGFLGNMIYIATSFTTFIGNGQFKKSWGLWYVAKPFTAAALAVGIYFVFRGGFLNMSDDSSNINIYGAMTISLLSGLFTDRTTLKLKEVFDVLLRPRDERTDPLTDDKPQITNVNADALEVGKDVSITINGKNLDKKPLTIKVEGQEIINGSKKPSEISFTYALPLKLKEKEAVILEILDDKGNAVYPPKALNIRKNSNVQEGLVNSDSEGVANGNGKLLDDNIINQEEFGDADSEDELNKPRE